MAELLFDVWAADAKVMAQLAALATKLAIACRAFAATRSAIPVSSEVENGVLRFSVVDADDREELLDLLEIYLLASALYAAYAENTGQSVVTCFLGIICVVNGYGNPNKVARLDNEKAFECAEKIALLRGGEVLPGIQDKIAKYRALRWPIIRRLAGRFHMVVKAATALDFEASEGDEGADFFALGAPAEEEELTAVIDSVADIVAAARAAVAGCAPVRVRLRAPRGAEVVVRGGADTGELQFTALEVFLLSLFGGLAEREDPLGALEEGFALLEGEARALEGRDTVDNNRICDGAMDAGMLAPFTFRRRVPDFLNKIRKCRAETRWLPDRIRGRVRLSLAPG